MQNEKSKIIVEEIIDKITSKFLKSNITNAKLRMSNTDELVFQPLHRETGERYQEIALSIIENEDRFNKKLLKEAIAITLAGLVAAWFGVEAAWIMAIPASFYAYFGIMRFFSMPDFHSFVRNYTGVILLASENNITIYTKDNNNVFSIPYEMIVELKWVPNGKKFDIHLQYHNPLFDALSELSPEVVKTIESEYLKSNIDISLGPIDHKTKNEFMSMVQPERFGRYKLMKKPSLWLTDPDFDPTNIEIQED